MRIFAVDLAARTSGYVVLDITEQPYRVVSLGIVAIKGEWGPDAWQKAQQEWEDCLEDLIRANHFAAIAYEVAGWAGQSGNSVSGHGTSRNTRRMLDQAEALFGAVAAGYTRRIMALDQAEVKLAITGHGRADKTAVSLALELRRQDGEFQFEGEFESEHEIDALSIALYAAALLRAETLQA